MNDVAPLLAAALLLVVLLPLVRVWAWCFADLRDDSGLDQSARTQWLMLLVLLNLVAIPVYVGFDPGKGRWDSRMLWWPWKR